MQYSQKYSLVSFMDPIDVGAEFNMAEWPLHVTLADVFAIDRQGSGIEPKLAGLLNKRSPVETQALEDAILGETEVVLLDRNDALAALHLDIVDLLEANRAIFNSPEFMREGFLPHCTVQKTARLNKGKECIIEAIALVDMFPNGDWQQRKVLSIYRLANA